VRIYNFIPIIIGLSIFTLLYFSLNDASKNNVQLSDLKLKLINGETLDLNEFKGKPYIIRFFASWCAACKDDYLKLKELSKQVDAPVIGIAIGDNIEAIKHLPTELLPYDYIYLDDHNLVKKMLMNQVIPETLIIDVDGNIALRHTGGL
jgi:thiol-disulfide isomerase/thioredoxin